MTSFYEKYIYAIPTIILMFAVGISFFRKLNHVDPSPIEAINDNPQKIVSTNEYEKITASTKNSMIKDKRIPQFFPGHAKRFNWKAFSWNFENGMSNSYENNIKAPCVDKECAGGSPHAYPFPRSQESIQEKRQRENYLATSLCATFA